MSATLTVITAALAMIKMVSMAVIGTPHRIAQRLRAEARSVDILYGRRALRAARRLKGTSSPQRLV